MSRRYVLDLISEVEFYSKLQSGFPLIKANVQRRRGKLHIILPRQCSHKIPSNNHVECFVLET